MAAIATITDGATETGKSSVFLVDPGPDRETLLRMLQKQHAELEDFVRALSHDMTANFLLVEHSFSRLKRLLSEPGGAEVGQLAAHVEACLRESRRFLDDLVGLARTGTVQMEPARVDVEEVLDEVLFEQGELLSARQVEIDVRHPLAEVWCNRHRFKQLLTNLVRNAVRHGCDPQRPRISVTAEEKAVCPTPVGPRAGPDRFVVLQIHDNGPGIDPRYHEEIFLPGRRLPRAAPEGTGMGLAIVRKIAEHYGGSAELDRDCPGGTAFLVRLPRAPDRTDAPAGHAPPPRQSAQGPRRPAHDPFGQGLILHPPRPSSQPAGPHGR